MYGLTNQKCLKSDKVAESIMGTMAVGGIKISGHESLRKHAEFKCRLCSTGINHREFSFPLDFPFLFHFTSLAKNPEFDFQMLCGSTTQFNGIQNISLMENSNNLILL